MSKQKEKAAAPTTQEQKQDKFDAALFELDCLEAGLNLDKASEQTRFFLSQIKKRLQEKTNRRFHEVINDLCQFFDDADFTYTKLMEQMCEAQVEIARLRDHCLQHPGDDGVRMGDFETTTCTDLFWKFSMLLWNVKPIAMEQERTLMNRGSDFVGYNVEEAQK